MPPDIVHHMAAHDGDAPPNSLAAVEACLRQGAGWIEVDATALADSDYLLVHDPNLQSETTGSGPVGECSAARARDLFIRRTESSTDHPVPLLGDVVKLMESFGGSSRLQVDFKNVTPFAIDEPLRRLARILEPLGDRVLVSSTADWQLRRLRTLAPRLELGFDVHFYLVWRGDRPAPDPRAHPQHRGAYGYWDDHPIARERIWTTAEYLADRCGALIGLVPGATTFYVDHHFLCQCLDDGFNWADALHRVGIRLDAWTLDVDNDRAVANARRLARAGVDQFTTNTPSGLARILRDT